MGTRRHAGIWLGVFLIGSLVVARPAPAQNGGGSCPPECPAPGGKINGRGQKSRTECYAEVGGVPVAANGTKARCTDGDETCDLGTSEAACDFPVVVCVNNDDPRFPRCTSPGIPAGGATVKARKGDPSQIAALQAAIDAILPADAATNGCSEPVTITVPLKEKRNGKLKKGKLGVNLKVKGESGRDNDKLVLECGPRGTCGDGVLQPGEECDGGADAACAAGCRNDCTCPPPSCSVNPAGGPNRLKLTVGSGADLDTGVSGISHNQGVTEGSTTFVCLQGCDLSSNPVCTGTGETNAGGKSDTINGDTFGAPLPLLSGGVPVCVINEYREDITLTGFNLQTGELDMSVRLTSKVHQAALGSDPCPTCRGSGTAFIGQPGTCRGGPNDGQGCTVDGLTTFGPTSKRCVPPGANNVGNLIIDLDLTTESVSLPLDGVAGGGTCLGSPAGVGGPCQCPGQRRRNECANENACSADECPSGLEPGVDQLCCRNSQNIALGCYPGQSSPGGTEITRTGIAAVPFADVASMTGAWPETTYPKTSEGGQLVSVFCIAATTSELVNGVAGLPGPGALILPGPIEVALTRCAGGDDGGLPCSVDADCSGGSACR